VQNEGKRFSRIAISHTPGAQPETEYAEHTSGWGLFPDQRKDVHEELSSKDLMGGIEKDLEPTPQTPKTSRLLVRRRV
jgi:hypothetical protein